MKRQAFLFVTFFLFAFIVPHSELLAAPYYEGKVIRMIVGHEAGGGYDRIARLMARYLPKYIPGKPTFVVENMPGASSMIFANYLYNIAKPDGLTIGTFDRSLPFAQLLKAEGVKFDLTKFSWIGAPVSESAILAIRTDLPYKTFDDLRKAREPIHLGATGTGATDYQFPILLKELLGLNLKMVMYTSSTATVLAIERKEVEGRAGSYTGNKPYIERGLLRPLIRGRISEPGIEHLPVNEDFATDKRAKTIMAMHSAPDRVGRPFAAPPGTPPEVMNILREAFEKACKDPDLKGESKKLMVTIQYVSADESMNMLDYVLKQPEEIVKEFSKYIKF